MTVKYTPGPWTRPWTTDDEFDHEAVLGVDGILVADCSILAVRARPPEINKANARLIAAAPELVDALLNTLQFAEACHRQCDDALMRKAIWGDIMRAREALEKAGVE